MEGSMARSARRRWTEAGLGTLLTASMAHAEIDAERLAGLRARSIGPAGMSGRVAAIDAVASDPDTVWAGASTGGVWKSVNGGLTWTPVFDDQPVHAVGAVAIFPRNPDVVWVGTGEGNVRNSASVGNGVYRTRDGGKTWQHLGLDRTERIYRILLHPTDAETAFVCAPGREWGENAERGVFRTTDGGRSWSKVLYVDERTGCGELAMDPGNASHLLAGMWQFRRWPWFFKSGGPGSAMYATWDGGTTWKKLQQEDGLPKGELGRMGIAFAPSRPEVVYANVEAKKSALLRSEDGGRTWKTVNDRASVNPRPFYFADLRVDPAWPNRVYSLDYNIRVSDDGGKTFAALEGAGWEDIHGDHHALWIDPADPDHMYAGDDGGVAVTRDRGKTFWFVANLPLAQYYHVSVDNERPYNIYGGLQDNGSWRGPSDVWRDGGIRNYDWQVVGGGDGFEVTPDPQDSQAGYSLWQGGNLMRYDVRTGEQRLVKPAAPEGTRLRFNWNAALATDPFEAGVVYLGSQFVHRSVDRGETWTAISPDLTTNDPAKQNQDQSGGLTTDVTAAENHTTIVSIAPSPLEKGLLWVGTDDGRVHVTRDGGRSWTSVEKNISGVPAGTWVPHVEPGRHAPGEAFVVFDNHRRSDWTPYLYRTSDYGRTWSSLAAPNLRGYALVLRQDPVARNLLFLGTEFGLYASLDGGRAWMHLKKTVPTASVMDLVVHPRDHDLVIATHGRALFVLDDLRPLRALSEASLQAPLTVYPVGDAVQHWVKPEEGGFGFGAGEFRGAARPYGAIITYSLNLPGLPLHDEEKERERKEKERQAARPPAGAPEEAPRTLAPPPPSEEERKAEEERDKEPKVDVMVADATGAVVRRFKAPARLGVNRASWNLRRDSFRQPPRGVDDPPPDEDPAGAELPPGSYTVTVRFRGHEGRQPVTVLPDPRARNTEADWKRREEAVRKVAAMRDAAVDAMWRLRRTRDDVAAVEARVRQSHEAKGERDAKVVDADPLIKAGTRLGEALTELEKKLWQSPETPGIQPETDVWSALIYAGSYVTSSWAPPSPTQMEHVARAEAHLARFQEEVGRFFESEVAAYRKQAQERGVALLGS
jgi:photosystem II stability/assembly factor-like uncharacterized protein